MTPLLGYQVLSLSRPLLHSKGLKTITYKCKYVDLRTVIENKKKVFLNMMKKTFLSSNDLIGSKLLVVYVTLLAWTNVQAFYNTLYV